MRTPAAAIERLTTTSRMEVKWTHLGLIFFVMLSIIMTGCFLWQYHLPKLMPEEDLGKTLKSEKLCPRYPKPTPLEHPIPYLKAALEKVSISLLQINPPTNTILSYVTL
ncbi:hypothetical protein PHYPO_G00114310 [Pangasianodon hypophthalmus]|uniref:Uncharacterized protein n=1 Tax=Pangasianodon hypophthalmus TaxID=310915 RepID=A0A5N5L2T1_PANHP|nr:hypothetical protein PHYPO_G00114310 [Pangasianodon hypophthalmus]